ncbi:partial Heparin-sulfate lyase, partial [Myxococcaceae bacterium]
MDLLRYYHTLKYLKPAQIVGRVLFRVSKPRPDFSPAPPARPLSGVWMAPARRRQSVMAQNRCCFLDEEHDISTAAAWNEPTLEKLWLYNLHYFDDLNAFGAAGRTAWQRRLIARWVAENRAGQGTGFEPYPTSLRVVNWIKWALAGNALEPAWLESLAVQTRWLAKRLEFHLLGNHLFVNAKALVFAGLFFEGPEAQAWLERGLGLLARELPEQILPDGGQFERSPMYHALALEDLLDLLNVAAAYPRAIPAAWEGLVSGWPAILGGMRHWLAALCHPDGEISFFNDAAIGIAPAPAELEAYALRLGLPATPELKPGLIHLADSGYVAVRREGMAALLDVAPVGPDYLPGHAHADTLSFELSLAGQRVLVNSGTSRYGLGEERQWQRGTAAHNTLRIDGQDSSEVWGGFRVARRAQPFGLRIEEDEKGLRVACSHDGYRRLRGKPVHRREWRFFDGGMEITDSIEGRFAEAVSRLYFHPGVAVTADGNEGKAGWEGGSLR